MDKISWIIALISTLFVLLFLFGAFILLYQSRKRLILEKHHDDIVEENIAVLYSEYLESQSDDFESFLSKKKQRRKIRGVILDIVLALVGIVMLAILAASVAYRFTGGQVYINNHAFYVVETDSMAEKNESHAEVLADYDDQIPAHTFIILEKLQSDEELVPYTIYAYEDKDGNIIVHRFIRMMEDGTYFFRGDSNDSPIASDVGVGRGQIIGKFTGYQNHPLGETIYYLKSPFGWIVLAGLFGIFIGQTIYSDKLDRLYRQRYEILFPKAKEIHSKYLVIDGDRKKKRFLLRGIAKYSEGSVFYVLHGDNQLSTGEKVRILKEEEKTCLCRILSDTSDYDSTPIRIQKKNLSAFRTRK